MMSTKTSVPILIVLVFVLALAFAASWFARSSEQNVRAKLIDEHISLANKMRDEHLYREAISEFGKPLEEPALARAKKSNISYLIATIYFDDLKDYEHALAYYVRAKFYDEKNPQKATIEQRIVACLEQLGRTQDAQYRLANATYLAGEKTAKYPGRVVAKIGDREITRGELEAQLEKLPEQQRAQFQNDAAKLEFLRQYIASELIYDAAKAAGMDKDEQVRERLSQVEKMLLTNKYLQEKIQNPIQVSDTEIKLYYDAHHDDLAEGRRVKIAHILLGSEKEANDVLARLKNGADFADLVRSASLDNSTKDTSGVLGFVAEETDFVPSIGENKDVAQSLLRLQKNDLSDVIKIDKGYHIFKIVDVIPRHELTRDEAKPRIIAALRRDKASEAEQKLIDEMLKARQVVIYEGEFQTGSDNAKRQ
jgi:peptidyl-prolyl cis-trans isomerase C